MRFTLFLLLLTNIYSCLFAQNGHEIKIKIDGFEEDVMYLAYHLGSKQYVKDTVYRGSDDTFVFKRADERLSPGNYMVVLPPSNQTFDLLINKNEQHFSVSTKLEELAENMVFEGQASDNKLLYDYLTFLKEQRVIRQALENLPDEAERLEAIDAVDKVVRTYQNGLIKNNPETMSALIVKANMPIDEPSFEGTAEEVNIKRWRHAQAHFFDNLDLTNDALLRTPLINPRVEHFIDKLQVQHPDTIALAIDQVLAKMPEEGELYKHFVVYFLNKYAKSKLVGMDAVYVHMALSYYGKGKAPWIETDQLKKIIDNAQSLAPLLIGKTAPDLKLKNRDGSPNNLHSIESEYTVLYFWRPDCDHCKKESPLLQEFFQEYRDKGVKVVAICTKGQDELSTCWDYLDENHYADWIQLADPKQQSGMFKIYDIKSTPQIYLLDKDKKIVTKRIGASQLSEVIDQSLNRQN